MKFLENLFIKLFSLIVCVLSILIILVRFDIIDLKIFSNFVKFLYSDEIKSKITIIVSIVFVLISFKIMLTKRGKPKNGKDGIILENGNGKLIISKESLDNMIFNASKDVLGAENISSKTYLDLEQNLRVFVTVTVSSDVSIKDISTRLQSKIKSAIKQTADLEVSEVNVKIKNIVNKKAKRKDNTIKMETVEVTNENTIESNVELANNLEINNEEK